MTKVMLDTPRRITVQKVFFWSVFSRIRIEYGSEWGKILTRKTPNTDSLHAGNTNSHKNNIKTQIFVTPTLIMYFYCKNSNYLFAVI